MNSFNFENFFYELDIIHSSLFSSIILLCLINLVSLYKFSFFPRVKSDKKIESMKFRGLGVLYLISILPFFYINFDLVSLKIIILIFTLTLLGFVDDKYDLNSRFKLIIFLLISLIYNIVAYEEFDNFFTFPEFFNFISNFLLLIFLILFFNQIDGINGLAGLTYCVSVLVIITFFNKTLIFLPFMGIILIYLFFNLRGKVGIQGDSGSYFLASTFFILVTNYTQGLNFYYSIFFLCPILFDVVCTTLMRFIMNENIFKAHKDNLYQKIASYYQSHLFATFCFVLIQMIFSIFNLYFLINKSFLSLILINVFAFIIFFYVAYLIYQKRILFKKT